jgi:urease accessory protein
MFTEPSRTEISVARPPGGGRVALSMSASSAADRPVVRPMVLAADEAGARISLVPDGALLLAGDAVSIAVTVGPGARLELVEPGGTVAYAMDGGRASWDVAIDLAPAASLVWAGEPFVIAAGAEVDRRTSISLAWGATLALRETLVFGRHREVSGRLRQEVAATGPNGAQILAESLTVSPESSPLLLGVGTRAVGSVLTLGHRMPPDATGAGCTHLDLVGQGTLARSVAAQTHQLSLEAAWTAACHGVLLNPRGRSVLGSRTPGRALRPRTRLG